MAERYKKTLPKNLTVTPCFYASGFSFPDWRIITSADDIISMQWGLIPHWFQGENYAEISSMTLNARIESIDEKPSFSSIIGSQRCIIPSTGFFEWKAIGKQRVPYFIYPTTDVVFSIAGIYDLWQDPLQGKLIRSFSIITGEANDLMREIHNTKKRMPIILQPNQEISWLNGDLDADILLNPASSDLMAANEISKKIMNSKTPNCPEVLLPFNNGIFEQGSLF